MSLRFFSSQISILKFLANTLNRQRLRVKLTGWFDILVPKYANNFYLSTHDPHVPEAPTTGDNALELNSTTFLVEPVMAIAKKTWIPAFLGREYHEYQGNSAKPAYCE
jgi:hypothetical protein